MAESITPWLHVLAATVWVGPQFFLFLAAIPAVRTIEDNRLRASVLRLMVTRFGWISLGALLIIVLTGISNIFQEAEDFNHLLDFEYRWVNYFSLKMVLVGIMLALTLVHTFIVGPRQLQLTEQGDADGEDLARLRRSSIALSGLVLLISVVVLFMGALLNNHDFSFQEA